MNRATCVLLLALAGASLAWEARSEPSATVVVVAHTDAPLGKRIVAELAAMGLTVRMKASTLEPIDDMARALHADGALRVNDTTLEVWLLERGSGRVVLERVPLGATDTEQVTAIHRATEIFRTQLLEPFAAPSSTPSSAPTAPTSSASVRVEPPENPPAHARPRHTETPAVPPLFGAWIGPTVAWSGPVTQTSFDLAAGAWLRALGPLRFEATIMRSLAATSVTATSGTSDIESWTLGLAARVRFGSARFGVGGGLGVAGVWLLMTGHAASPYLSDRADVFTSMPFAVVGVDFSPVHHFALRADLLAGFTAPRATIVFADAAVGEWGAPFLAATLAVEATWP